LLSQEPGGEPLLIGFCGNRITQLTLRDCLTKTRQVAEAISNHDYERAMDLRGGSFKEAFQTFRMMVRSLPHPPEPGEKRFRLAVMHSGALSPGMNIAARVAIRYSLTADTLPWNSKRIPGFYCRRSRRNGLDVRQWMGTKGRCRFRD
jgi:6-phosphofructokinase 1